MEAARRTRFRRMNRPNGAERSYPSRRVVLFSARHYRRRSGWSRGSIPAWRRPAATIVRSDCSCTAPPSPSTPSSSAPGPRPPCWSRRLSRRLRDRPHLPRLPRKEIVQRQRARRNLLAAAGSRVRFGLSRSWRWAPLAAAFVLAFPLVSTAPGVSFRPRDPNCPGETGADRSSRRSRRWGQMVRHCCAFDYWMPALRGHDIAFGI